MIKFKINLVVLSFVLLLIHNVNCLDNGLVKTPPMGWLQWARFVCETDCKTYPSQCISDRLFREMAAILANEYAEFGYEYVNIDDCWSTKTRDPKTHELVPDPERFPFGIDDLANFIHAKGLKIGIYGDIGTKTCQLYPGFQNETSNEYYFDLDAETFAKWGIDFLKVDGCFGDVSKYDTLYPELGNALNRTGRSIVYSCSWPAYLDEKNKTIDYNLIAKHCNLWRNFDDIEFSWKSVESIIDYYASHQHTFIQIQAPGQWFDPDMIIIGNNGLSIEQMKAQMAMWSILAAPLLMSNDLRTITPQEKAILTNRLVIAVDQDEYGVIGQRVFKKNNFEIWFKPIDPQVIEGVEHWGYAIVYLNRNTLGFPQHFCRNLKDIFFVPELVFPKHMKKLTKKIRHASDDVQYKVLDLFNNGTQIDTVDLSKNLCATVNVGGAVRMMKLVPEAIPDNYL